jgi:hypothetical protein
MLKSILYEEKSSWPADRLRGREYILCGCRKQGRLRPGDCFARCAQLQRDAGQHAQWSRRAEI